MNFRPTNCVSEAETWSYKVCPVKEHNAGVVTERLAIALLVFTSLCVGGRFLARWRLPNAGIGIDDWSVLISYMFIIPATFLIIFSKSSRLKISALTMLTLHH